MTANNYDLFAEDRAFCAGLGDRWTEPDNLQTLCTRAEEIVGYGPQTEEEATAIKWITLEDDLGNGAPFERWCAEAPEHNWTDTPTALDYLVQCVRFKRARLHMRAVAVQIYEEAHDASATD